MNKDLNRNLEKLKKDIDKQYKNNFKNQEKDKFFFIQLNSPFTILFFGLCILFFFLNYKISSPAYIEQLFSIEGILSCFLSICSHADLNHLSGNMTMFLLLAPILEERHGFFNMFIMTLLTSFITNLLSVLIYPGLSGLGASGIVFMLMILSSLTSQKNTKGIPLTFLLIFIFYIGKEIYNSFYQDNISQFAHISGGITGAIFGFIYIKNKK